MMFNLKSPCGNCPFRTDVLFYLHNERVDEILRDCVEGDNHFYCHKTTHHDDEDGDYNPNMKEQMCAGFMIMSEKLELPSQMMRIGERIGGYDYKKLKMDAPVFDTPDDMREEYIKRNKGEVK